MLGLHRDQGDEHLFQGDASVLEGIPIVLHVVVVVIRVGEEVVAIAEDVVVGEIGLGEADLRRHERLVDFLGVVRKGLADLIAQVGIGILVADDLHGVFHADGTVVGGEDDAVAHLGDVLEEVVGRRVAEPALRQRAVSGLGIGQLTDHLALGAGMGEHVHEVEDDDVERVLLEAIEVRKKAFAEACFVDLIVGEGIVLAVALQEGLDHGFLVEVLPFFALLVDP